MNNSDNNFYNNPFSYIYVEEAAFGYAQTQSILAKFPNASVIRIKHYKDIFNRKNQDTMAQKHSQQLILAVAKDNFVYPGAAVCQDFGNKHFYYTSLMMNCIYDCEYCYLQGMYPSGNLVIFVNIEDFFESLEKMLCKHEVYLCISFDSDLMAFEHITGYVSKWIEFCRSHQALTIEVRTKSANFKAIKELSPPKNVILAWTLTPEYVVTNFEHKTPSLNSRLLAVQAATDAGYNVRLCFDPILLLPDYKTVYGNFFEYVFSKVNPDNISDVSFGEFRVSCDYLKRMRKLRPCSQILQYPYDTMGGVATYGNEKNLYLLNFIKNVLAKYFSCDKIYCWEGDRRND